MKDVVNFGLLSLHVLVTIYSYECQN